MTMLDQPLTVDAKATVGAWVDEHLAELSEWHSHIWNLAEPAWREYRSAKWYVERLRAEGFEVEEGSAGMPTAFSASWSNGDGPTLLTYAEYDAVPGIREASPPSTSEVPPSIQGRRAIPLPIGFAIGLVLIVGVLWVMRRIRGAQMRTSA